CCDIVRDTSLPVMATIRERFRTELSPTRPPHAEQRDEIATPRKKPDSGIAAPCMLLGVGLLRIMRRSSVPNPQLRPPGSRRQCLRARKHLQLIVRIPGAGPFLSPAAHTASRNGPARC